MTQGDDALLEVLRAVTVGDWDDVARLSADAVEADPDDPLAAALHQHLADGPIDPTPDLEAFQRMADAPESVALFERTARLIARAHARLRPVAAVDLGSGDGRVSAAAMRVGLERLDLVEPSRALLEAAVRRMEDSGVDVRAHRTVPDEWPSLVTDETWGVAQAVFALHDVAPEARRGILTTLAERADTVLIVEFDCPVETDRTDPHLAFLVDRYRAAVADATDPLIVGGYLLPVLVGQLSPGATRHAWEQPIAAWCAEVEGAGLRVVDTSPISDHWWASAHLIEATAR